MAHKGLVTRPSDNLAACASCHEDEAKKYGESLHYTTSGLAQGISKRFSQTEYKAFRDKVFEKSCRSCHASCGDCHVRVPIIGDVKQGLIKNHAFVKRDEGKTCALCHGGRVYPEFTGEYAGMTDVHYEKGMTCVDCHKKAEMHGTGTVYTSRRQVREKPTCAGCHKTGSEKNEKARTAHVTHANNVSCSACHASAPYTNCTECHLGKGAKPERGFFLGRNPHDKKSVATLRLVPVVRDTFKPAGIGMSNYDSEPNYWDATPHNIKKRTKRTRTCDACHTEKQFFLTKESLPKDGSKANLDLLYAPKPLKK